MLFWGGYLKWCNHHIEVATIKTPTSTCAGREMSHTTRSCLHASMPQAVQLAGATSPCRSPAGTRSAWGFGRLLTTQQTWALLFACHSWWILLRKLSYPKSMLVQKWAIKMCLNKYTCIFLALGVTVNSLDKYMYECLYPFKYHHQATRMPNVLQQLCALLLHVLYERNNVFGIESGSQRYEGKEDACRQELQLSPVWLLLAV